MRLIRPRPGLPIDLKTLRNAGQRRYRTALELRDFVSELSATERNAIRELLKLPAIAGGSQNVLNITASAAALTSSQVTYIGPVLGIPQAPLILALHHLPQIAGTTATATITLQMRRTDTPAVIANAVHLCGTADTNPGPFDIIGIVPAGVPAGSGVDVQGAASSGAGTPTASATAPITLAVVGLA